MTDPLKRLFLYFESGPLNCDRESTSREARLPGDLRANQRSDSIDVEIRLITGPPQRFLTRQGMVKQPKVYEKGHHANYFVG
jgi:hypothetical protein